jgi:hypothetical protein
MHTTHRSIALTRWALALMFGILLSHPVRTLQAATDLADIPVSSRSSVNPNLILVVDDSGSMDWEITPSRGQTSSSGILWWNMASRSFIGWAGTRSGGGVTDTWAGGGCEPGSSGCAAPFSTNPPRGPINFNATHSLQDDGSDLPLNDINTIRFFYNLGIEYYRLNLAPPHAAHMPVSIAPPTSAMGPTAYLSNSYYPPMSNSNNQTGVTSSSSTATNTNTEQQIADKTGLNLSNSSSSINQQVVPNGSSQTQINSTNLATGNSMSTSTVSSSANNQKSSYSRRVH